MSLSKFKSNVLVRAFTESFRSTLRWYMRFIPWLLGMTAILGALLMVAFLPSLSDRYLDLPEMSRPAGRAVSVHSFGRAFAEYSIVETDIGFFPVAGFVTVTKGQELNIAQHQKSFRLCTPLPKQCMKLLGTQFVDRMGAMPTPDQK